MIYKYLLIIFFSLIFSSCSSQNDKKNTRSYEVDKSEKEWKQELTSEEYYVLRQKGTEKPFANEYNAHNKKGTYTCAACGNSLFSSAAKYDSKSGWPSFYQPVSESNVVLEKDYSMGTVRDEVLCAKCGGHLGHVFDDGPQPTGLRYCVNSVAMDFKPKE